MTSLLGRGTRRDTPTRPDPSSGDARALVGVALRPTGAAIALLSAVVLVTLVSSNSDLTGAVGAIAASWFALHQVSLTITDAPLGILPLLPTAVLMWAVARGCARSVEPDTDPRAAAKVVGAAVAGPLAATLIALAVVTDASAVMPISSPNAGAALAWVVAIHVLAAGVGVVSVVGRTQSAALGAPTWLPSVVRPAVRAAVLLFAAGSAVALASLVWSWSEVGDLLGEGGGVVGVLGLTLLSVLYLPNVAVGGVAVLLGGTASAGGTSVSVFEIVSGPVPPVPVLGGVPAELAGPAWPVLLLVPVAVGALLGRDCSRLRLAVQDTAFAVLSAAAVAGVLATVVGFAAGGELGAYGFVGVEPWALGLLTFGWLALPGLVVATALARRNGPESDGPESNGPESNGPESDGPDVAVAAASADAAGEAGAEEAPAFEVKRLALPSMRYRSEVVPESDGETRADSDAADGALEAEVVDGEPSAAQSADGESEDDALDVVEVEVAVAEDDSGASGDSGEGASEGNTEAERPADAEGDLPDGPVTPRD